MLKRYLCPSCQTEGWCRFAASKLLENGCGFLTLVFASNPNVIAVLTLLKCVQPLAKALLSFFRRERANISSIFASPFHGKRDEVDDMDQIVVGDAISFDHWKLSHAAIVSEVTKHDATSGKLKVIHYSLPKMFGTRMIVEEDLIVNLEKDQIVRHDYSGYSTYNADEVVKRARKRIGETKYWVFNNRSCHFTYWAKMKNPVVDPDDLVQNEASNNELVFQRTVTSADTWATLSHLDPVNIDHRGYRKHATKTFGSVRANIRDEIHAGQIVEFKYKHKYTLVGLKHKAICTKVTFDEKDVSKLKLKVVHVNRDRRVVEEGFEFDLRYDNIWVHPLHPINRFSPDEVIRRAKARTERTDNRSSHLVDDVVKKKDKHLVHHVSDIKPGEVAVLTYWGLAHDVVVTKVEPNESKDDKKGHIKIVHYALEHLFATRTVKEEMIAVDLTRDRIYIKDFHGYVTYPPGMVVQRAQSRKGEQRYNMISNTSTEVAFWSKVVQTPAIVSLEKEKKDANKKPDDEPSLPTQFKKEDDNKKPAKEILLLPDVGTKYNGLQRVLAYSWDDLELGMIIEYYYYWIPHQGILTHIDNNAERVKVIHYGANHIFATRTIMENTLTINMRKDTIKIYIADPRRAHDQQVILKKARARLGEQKWGFRNKSWDFCRSCVLKDEN